MGLWAWAELSTGIIVGCLPTLPKFFQHIGPKIHRSIYGTGLARKSSSAPSMPALHIPAIVKMPFAKYGVGASVLNSWNDPYSPRGQLHDNYLSLGEFDASLPQATTSGTLDGCPSQGNARVRDDLEYGQQKI